MLMKYENFAEALMNELQSSVCNEHENNYDIDLFGVSNPFGFVYCRKTMISVTKTFTAVTIYTDCLLGGRWI